MDNVNSHIEVEWYDKEFVDLNLGDERLNRRFKLILENSLKNAGSSIPNSQLTQKDTKAAYRFFDNDRINKNSLIEPHYQCTINRMTKSNVILAVQDTSYIIHSHHPKTKGLGRIYHDDDKSNAFIIHPTLALTESGIPLGLIDSQMFVRKKENLEDNKFKKFNHRSFMDKESRKWFLSYRKTSKYVREIDSDVRVVNICDSEGDIYYLFKEYYIDKNEKKSDLLVRACQDRNIEESDDLHLKEYIESKNIEYEYSIDLKENHDRKEREAKLSVRFCEVTIKLREKRRKMKNDRPLKLWAILAKEEKPPKNEEGIYWLLLTTISINSINDACEKVNWYSKRWMIEIYFKTLKSCCKIEDRQLKEFKRLKLSLVVDMIVAWRILFLTYVGRIMPDLPASTVLNEYEWQALHMKVNKTNTIPDKEPDLHTVYYQIGKIAGHLNRKNDPPPGILIINRGLLKLYEFASAFYILSKNVGKG